MEFLKELFGEDGLTYDKFVEAVNTKGYKLADLSTGNYVSKGKYDDDLKQRDTTITDLQSQIATRDTDLSSIKAQLESADSDNKTKVAELTTKISSMQSEYDTYKTEAEAKLAKQSYEFAVREFANSKKFTSNAAKRDFISEMLSEDLKLKDNIIIGADDFVKAYSENNSDAFVVEAPVTPSDDDAKPQFVMPGEQTPPPSENAFAGMFNFAGVRPHDTK